MADRYADLDWEFHDIVIARPDGAPVFEQRGVEVPSSWSMNAATILAQKFFRAALGSPERESSLKQVIRRVIVAIAARRVADGNFVGDDQARIFTD